MDEARRDEPCTVVIGTRWWRQLLPKAVKATFLVSDAALGGEGGLHGR